MEIKRADSQSSSRGSSDWFTGTVRIDALFEAPEPARVRGASVTFEPGARTAWHTHPLGQTLIVTSGLGWAQQWGGEVQELRPGDVVWFPPNEKHWHGASPTSAMTHIAIQEALDGRVVEWMEKVSKSVTAAKSLRLLLVDDHADTREVLSRLLSKSGHEVVTADSADKALKILDGGRFDALISDIGLPDCSGYELVREAKRRQPLKGIALSGLGMDDDVLRSMEAGFDCHLTKPINFQELKSVLEEIG